MRVFVAGATGALGVPTVRRLVAHGHEVVGLTRSPAKRGLVESLGATPAVADVLDPPALKSAMAEAEPDAIVHALTALPKNGPTRTKHLVQTNVLRDEGTRNLIEAAASVGARRIVAESIVLIHGFGEAGVITEDTPIAERAPHPSFQDALDALLSLERQLRDGPLEGIALRYGFFYGPGVGSTEFAVRMARRRTLPIPGDGSATVPWIHMEDAAEATVLALERGRPGEAYNVVDDEAVSADVYISALAAAVGAPKPRHAPVWLLRLFAPYLALGSQARLVVSNDKAKRELGWSLRYPTYREGFRTLGESAAA